MDQDKMQYEIITLKNALAKERGNFSESEIGLKPNIRILHQLGTWKCPSTWEKT